MMHTLLMTLATEPTAPLSWYEHVLNWAHVKTTWDLVLVSFGVVAQLIFLGRWLVQWIASERRGESHVPQMFWWLSLGGATMLLIYFILRAEPVGIMGQLFGWVVYSRNLYLINKKNGQSPAA